MEIARRSETSGRLSLRPVMQVAGVVIAVLLLSFPAFSQTANGRIGGSVKDATGGSLAGAAVTVTDVARGLVRNLTTDDAGIYSAPNLLPGTYTVRATFSGFQTFERQNIVLEVGADLAIDAVLQPGAQTQTVTVTEELPLVNTTSSTLGGTLAPALMQELPISGRNFMNLEQLQPGVVLQLGSASDGGGSVQTNGLRPEESNEYLIEGLHAMDPYTGQSIVNLQTVNHDAAGILPVDAIQEFNMQFDPKAEYGFRAGGSVGVGLKSGTNAWHGDAFAQFRGTPLDARSYFNIPSQPFKNNGDMQQEGAVLGGPIKKDKLFFFLAYEQQNYTYGAPNQVNYGFTDPSLTTGVCSGATASLSTCSGVPGAVGGLSVDPSNDLILACLAVKNPPPGQKAGFATALSPQSLFIAGLQPDCTPNAAAGSGPSLAGVTSLAYPGYFAPHGATDHGAGVASNAAITSYFPNAQVQTLTIGSLAKVDYQLNSQNSLNGFFYKSHGKENYCPTCVNPAFGSIFYVLSTVGAGSWTYLPNSVMANSLRVGYASVNKPDDSIDALTKVSAAGLGIPTGISPNPPDPCACLNAGFPNIMTGPNTASTFFSTGGRMSEREGPSTSIEISDQMSYLHGKHSLKFGLDIVLEHFHGGVYTSGKGTFNATSLVGFFAGLNAVPAINSPLLAGANNIGSNAAANGISMVSTLFGNPIVDVHRPTTSLFIQDDYRIRPRLTLNLGLRWQYSGNMTESSNLLGCFDPTMGMTQIGVNCSQPFAPDRKAFAPRVGFAYDVFGNGKTVVRAGASRISELVTLRTFLDNNVNISNMPTGFVIGCSGPLSAPVGNNNVPAGQTSNCNGKLLIAGGTITTAVSTFSAANNDLGIPGVAPTAVNWDGPATGTASSILPVGLTVPGNCNSNIFTAAPGVSGAQPQPGIPGGACNIEFANPSFKTPYVEGWNASIQQAIRNNIVLTVAYVGNHGSGLIGQTNINEAHPNVPGVAWNAVQTAGPNAGQTLGQSCISNALGNTGQSQSTIDGFCVPGSLDNKAIVANIPTYGNVTAKNLTLIAC